MDFVPPPDLGLLSGHLYNIVSCLLSAAVLLFTVWLFRQKAEKDWRDNAFALFLLCLGGEQLLIAGANLAGFLHAPAAVTMISGFIRLLTAVTPLPLIVYLVYDITGNKFSARLTVLPFALLAGLALLVSAADPLAPGVSYWGTQCLFNPAGRGLLFTFIFLPVFLAAAFMIVVSSGKRREITPHLSIIAYLLLGTFNQLTLKLNWYDLLPRGGYLFIGLAAYFYFVRGANLLEPFVPANSPLAAGSLPRRSLFIKLLFLFVLLSIVPISLAALLMFFSFKEIIDVYVYKPLLWNLKTTHAEFLAALRAAQLQAGLLLVLTVAVVLVATAAASRALAESLRRVILGMKRVAKGDFNFKLRPESNDEIGDVVAYFNDMSQEIKRARDVMENWNKELEIKVAERTEDLQTLFDIARAIGSSLDLERLIRQTMARLGVLNFSLLNPDQTVRFSGGSAEGQSGALRLPIKT
ncbi:MAG TPA: HAMP domain-containing protein, partial [Candidatus Sulfotelmatobacter sp.]|nr:HAMP domain-containing protein [Candidatus Sulfotelmatobacter sp.]